MIVYEQGVLPCGGASTAVVKIQLWGAGAPIAGRDSVNQTLIQGECTVIPDASGAWTADLVPNNHIVPENTTYRIVRSTGCAEIVSYITVPSEGGPYEAFTIQGDPMNAIAPTALAGHAGSLSLHGGGVEIDYAELTSNVEVTGSALAFQQVTGLHVDIPDIARPVIVEAKISINLVTGLSANTALVVLTAAWDGTPASPVSVLDGLDLHQAAVTDATTVMGYLMHRVPPNSPGQIALAGGCAASPHRLRFLGGTTNKSKIWARTA